MRTVDIAAAPINKNLKYGLHLQASVRFPEMAPPSKFGQKEKKPFNISFNLNILAFLAIKLVQILFKQIARYLFGMIF